MLKKWCSSYWLNVMYLIGIVMAVLMILNRNVWSYEFMLMASVTVILPLHVLEEWRLPGGFHFGYNMLFKSKTPNSYPMNMLVDMCTNFFGELLFLLILLVFPDNGAMLGLTIFCYVETFGHTAQAIYLYIKLKKKGKKTLYSPGIATGYIAFLPAGILMTRYLLTVEYTANDWTGLVVVLVGIIACLFVPDLLFKNKNTPYAYPSAGYFKRFE